MEIDCFEEIDEDLLEVRKREKEQVRDFIERLVESLLGGVLDDVKVTKLYDDEKCKSEKIAFLWSNLKLMQD